MAALTVIDPRANLATIGHVLADASAPIAMRERAANLLGNLDFAEAKTALLSNLPTAPERLQSAIAASLVRRREGADALLEAIASGKASARLLQQRPVTISLESSGLPASPSESPHCSRACLRRMRSLPPCTPAAATAFKPPRPTLAWVQRCLKRTARSATNLEARAPRSARSSTASAAAASTA